MGSWGAEDVALQQYEKARGCETRKVCVRGSEGPCAAYSPDSAKKPALYLCLTLSRMVKEPIRKLRGLL